MVTAFVRLYKVALIIPDISLIPVASKNEALFSGARSKLIVPS
jgi:hypothetical protein